MQNMPTAKDATETQANIAWPAMLHYAGQDELAYLADMAAWGRFTSQSHAPFHRGDRVIDSEGRLYRPVAHGDHVSLESLGDRIGLQEAIALIRRHQAAAGQCCVAKFGASSIEACIALIGDEKD